MRAVLIAFTAFIGLASAQSEYQDAVALVQQSHSDRAIPILQQVLAKAPGDLKARNLLGIALLNCGRREEAAAEFRRAAATNPSFYPAIKNLGIAEIALGHRADGRTHFEQVLKLAPDDPVSHLNLGELDFADRRFPEALAHYRRSAGLYLKDGEIALRALQAAVDSSNPIAAIDIGEQLNRSAQVLSLLARAYELSGDTQRAYDALRAATQQDPSNESIYLDLLALCLNHHTWDLAIQVADAAIERMPGSFRLHIQRGAVLALKGEVEPAEREFAEAVRLAPREVLPQVSLALARVQLNRIPEAVADLRACRQSHPEDYLTTWILGEVLSQQVGGEPEAITLLEEAVHLGPRAAAPRLVLGKVLARRGDLARAAREFEAGLELQPDDVSAQYQLATIYRKTGNIAEADKLFEKVGSARAVQNPQESAKRILEQVIRTGR